MEHTTHGEIWEQRHTHGEVAGELDTIKVGTGTAAESAVDTGLAEQAYATSEPAEINLIESADGTKRGYYVELAGAQNVPAETAITEMGIFVSGTADDGTAIDFGDLAQYTDADGDLMYVRDTESAKVVGEGSLVIEQLTLDWGHI
jgi:hypothetical protein